MTFFISRKYLNIAFAVTLLLLSSSLAAFGQSLTLASSSATPGGSVSLNLTLSATTAPASLGWKLTYPSTVASANVAAGAALTSAGKSLTCNPSGGSIVCVASNSNNTIPNGVVAVVTATLASTATATSTLDLLNAKGALADGSALPVSGSGGTIGVTGTQTPTTPALSSISCSPVTVVTPGSSSCSVALSAPAGSAGLTVSMYENGAALTAPLSVAVPAGASSANFNVSAASVSASETDTLTASLNGVNKSVSLALQPASAATSGIAAAYAFDETAGSIAKDSSDAAGSAQVVGGTWAAGKYGNAVSLDGNSYVDLGQPSALQTGGSMSWSAWVYPTGTPADDGQIVARSDDNAGWQFKTSPDTGVRTFGVAVTGAGAARTQRYSKTTVALNQWYHVAGVYNASSGTLDIYVNGALDNGTLSGSVPASQVVPTLNTTVGRRTGGSGYYFQGMVDNLRIYTRALSASDVQNDMNSAIGGSAPAPQAGVSALQCSPSTVAAGASSTCTVTLSTAAPSGGASVTISDNSSALTVPASVTVAAGATTATFTAAAGSVTANQAVTVTASLNGSSAAASLTVTAPASTPSAVLSGLSCSPSSLSSGASSTCTVTLSGAAPAGGAAVALSDACSTLSIPASVTVPAGAASATFTASAGSTAKAHTDVITATWNGATVSVSIRHRR